MLNEKNKKLEIVISPEIEKLENEINELKKALCDLHLEYHFLIFTVCPKIEARYLTTIGVLEHAVFKKECKYYRLIRKYEKIQAKKNIQEKYNLDEIEKELDEEFAEYLEKIREQKEKMDRASDLIDAPVLTEEETIRIKKIYKKIVRELHPDLNPNASDEEVELLQKAIVAYKNGDLEQMEIFEVLVDEIKMKKEKDESLNSKRKEKNYIETLKLNIEKIETAKTKLEEKIEHIKNTYPYKLKHILEDDKARKDIIQKLKKKLETYEEYIELMTEKIREQTRDYNVKFN